MRVRTSKTRARRSELKGVKAPQTEDSTGHVKGHATVDVERQVLDGGGGAF